MWSEHKIQNNTNTYNLLYYSILLLIHYFTMWPWPLTLDTEHLQLIACDMIKRCTKFERNGIIHSGVIAISVFDLMTLNMFKCCTRLWDNFHQVWPSTTYPCMNYSVFMLIRYVTLWPLPLTHWTWKFVAHQASRYQSLYKIWEKSSKSPAELLIILRIFAHVMSRCDLDLWPLDFKILTHFVYHAFKLHTKFEWNRMMHSWVIDDLAVFACNFRGGARLTKLSQGGWIQLHQTWPGHKVIMAALHFCFRIQISCCIFKRGRVKVEWCFKRRKILHFLTPCEN